MALTPILQTLNSVNGASRAHEDDSRKRTDAEIFGDVTPVNYSYLPGRPKRHDARADSETNDTAALLRMIAAMPASGGQIQFDEGATYMIDASNVNGLLFSGKTNFKIFGNGATIKVLDGEAVTGGYGMVYFTNCQDGYIENLVLDANRAGRTPDNVGAYNVVVQDSCARLHFKNVRAINGVVDGWTLTTSVPDTLSTYPTDITIEDCTGENCYRNGLSAIGTLRLTIRGGSYRDTNGTSPQDGIDIEPDTGYTFGNTDLTIDGVNVSGNTGYGLALAGPGTAPNTHIVIRNVRGRENGFGLMELAQATNVLVDGVMATDYSTLTRGVIDVGTQVTDVTIRNVKMKDITASQSTDYGIYVHSSATGPIVVENVEWVDIACKAYSFNARTRASNLKVIRCDFDAAAEVADDEGHILKDLTFELCSGRALVVSTADTEVNGVDILNCGATDRVLQFTSTATGAILQNVNNRQQTSIPGSQKVVRWEVAPRIMRNVYARSAGTDYTAANIAEFTAGTAGSYISDCQPDPFRATATWDPASIADGDQTSQTFTVTGASLGDPAKATLDSDLQGLTLHAYVSSANTVTVVLANNTGGAVNLSNSNVIAWVEKR
jgi:hypothetical protein